MKKTWSIQIHKDYLKFSAAHFLIFPDGSAERLHGHNYKVYVDVETPLDRHGLVINFKEIKPIIREVVDELDEYVLIPGQHPVLTCEPRDDGLYDIRYGDRRYLIPIDEVRLLPISNSSAENLAEDLSRFEAEEGAVVEASQLDPAAELVWLTGSFPDQGGAGVVYLA
ncbi:MAG: 6-pyruvoyl trahydropterin synthase family protein, partial [Planctomycetota bacterium]